MLTTGISALRRRLAFRDRRNVGPMLLQDRAEWEVAGGPPMAGQVSLLRWEKLRWRGSRGGGARG